jgi:predicted GNAT superfamily acetyltransferase
MPGPITIELVHDTPQVFEALGISDVVWGPESAGPADLYIAVVRHGGYMAIARDRGVAVGTSFGFLTDGGRGLHSHFTGVVGTHVGTGVGRQLKQFQRSWAADQGIEHITWTFDPLVRRNAWFNLVRLGARVIGYHEQYYGPLNDAINGGDETDRLEVLWPVADVPPAEPVTPTAEHRIVPTPPDIESLRASDMPAALDWRRRLREALGGPLSVGGQVLGLTVDGSYVVDPAPPAEGPP